MRLESVPWADLVYHVLAHVRETAGLPASVYDARYVRFAERCVGAAAERPLGQDATHLGRAAPTHAALSHMQLIAWLFRDFPRARAVSAQALSELDATQVDDPSVLGSVTGASELLWCAALLELDAYQALPPPEFEHRELELGLRRMIAVAPGLGECRVELVRALCRRGRVRDTVIWIGAPDPELGVSIEHVLWQASHEATVRELGLRARELASQERPSEREIEHASVVLLARRALARGLGEEHRRWLEHFGSHGPSLELASLTKAARRLV